MIRSWISEDFLISLSSFDWHTNGYWWRMHLIYTKKSLGAKQRHLFMRIALTEFRSVDISRQGWNTHNTNSYPYPEAPWKKRWFAGIFSVSLKGAAEKQKHSRVYGWQRDVVTDVIVDPCQDASTLGCQLCPVVTVRLRLVIQPALLTSSIERVSVVSCRSAFPARPSSFRCI